MKNKIRCTDQRYSEKQEESRKLQASSIYIVFDVSHDMHYISSSDMTIKIHIPYH